MSTETPPDLAGEPRALRCGDHRLNLEHPQIMGVLNVTPDSFSDGGQFLDASAAVSRARVMVEEGATIIDVGGESTRPGAEPVSAAEECDRVVPVIEALVDIGVPISIDTSKPEVMRAACRAGVSIINDVNALRAPGAIAAAADTGVPVVLMHMQGEPRTMQNAPHYDDVVGEVVAFLGERAHACVAGGIDEDRLIVDPGFGFGKTLQHNLALLRDLSDIVALGYPVLAGLSRKSMLGRLLDQPDAAQRVNGSLAAALYAVKSGANILRVHDVRATREALTVWHAIETGVTDG